MPRGNIVRKKGPVSEIMPVGNFRGVKGQGRLASSNGKRKRGSDRAHPENKQTKMGDQTTRFNKWKRGAPFNREISWSHIGRVKWKKKARENLEKTFERGGDCLLVTTEARVSSEAEKMRT